MLLNKINNRGAGDRVPCRSARCPRTFSLLHVGRRSTRSIMSECQRNLIQERIKMAKKAATRETSKGICDFCKGEFDKSKMTQHLKYCKQRIASMETTKSQEQEKTKLFHLVVEGRDLPMYWMHIEMPVDATLAA